MKKKLVGAATPGEGLSHLAAVESDVWSRHANLVAHCSVMRYDDGTVRRPGWITIKTQGSAWVVQLKDPDACAQMQCLGNTLDDALALAELMLGADDAPWEPDQWMRQQEAKKKK